VPASIDTEAVTPEIDGFEAAATSQDKHAALTFIEQFPASHLVSDGIELLRPEVVVNVAERRCWCSRTAAKNNDACGSTADR
jgi:hypothetical protein